MEAPAQKSRGADPGPLLFEKRPPCICHVLALTARRSRPKVELVVLIAPAKFGGLGIGAASLIADADSLLGTVLLDGCAKQ